MSMLLHWGSPGGEGIASNPERHGHAVVDYFVAFDLYISLSNLVYMATTYLNGQSWQLFISVLY